MTTTLSTATGTLTLAQTYYRTHEGKLMVVQPTTNRQPVDADFFHLDSVGTHPTGLFVTGKFTDGKLKSMRVSTVREASDEEIASMRTGSEMESPEL